MEIGKGRRLADSVIGSWLNVATMGSTTVNTKLTIEIANTFHTRMTYESEKAIQVIEHFGTVIVCQDVLKLKFGHGTTSKTMKDGSNEGFANRPFDGAEQAGTKKQLFAPMQYTLITGQLVTMVKGPEGEKRIIYDRI